jgi:hypothetical protein
MYNLEIEHWTDHYLGIKYNALTYDCWAHFITVQKEVFGIEGLGEIVNISHFDNHDDAVDYIKTNPKIKNDWEEENALAEGCALDGGKVIGRVEAMNQMVLDLDIPGLVAAIKQQVGIDVAADMGKVAEIFADGFNGCTTIAQRVDQGGMVQNVVMFDGKVGPLFGYVITVRKSVITKRRKSPSIATTCCSCGIRCVTWANSALFR